MKKVVFALCALVAATAFAGISGVAGYSSDAVFTQFTHDEATNTGNYTDYQRPDQNWLAAQTIKLTLDSACDVWVSNYVSNWFNESLPLDGNTFDMSAGNYGAVDIKGGATAQSSPWFEGDTTTVTYSQYADGSGLTKETTAYFVGHYDAGVELSFWMTTLPEDGHEQVDMQQYVADAGHETNLVSREDKTHDQANNVRINFSLATSGGREFVAFGVADGATPGPSPSGQPLPGILFAGLIAAGTIATAKKMKKRA